MEKQIFEETISLQDTSEDIPMSEINKLKDLFNKDEAIQKRLNMEKKGITEGQINYIKYLAFQTGKYNRLNSDLLEDLSMFDASQIIEDLKEEEQKHIDKVEGKE